VARLRLGSVNAAITVPLTGHHELLAFASGLEDLITEGETGAGTRLLRALKEFKVGEVSLNPQRTIDRVVGPAAAATGTSARHRKSEGSAEASTQQEAINGIIREEQTRIRGFRAMIQKHAIMYNLAGYARNNPDGTVSINLQGDRDRIDKTLTAIRASSKISPIDIMISKAPATWDPNLKTFTVLSWTSTSRNITNPYDLIFHLRPANDEISKRRALAVWNTIAQGTLKDDDLAKFLKHRLRGTKRSATKMM
jgi:acylphosphatase